MDNYSALMSINSWLYMLISIYMFIWIFGPGTGQVDSRPTQLLTPLSHQKIPSLGRPISLFSFTQCSVLHGEKSFVNAAIILLPQQTLLVNIETTVMFVGGTNKNCQAFVCCSNKPRLLALQTYPEASWRVLLQSDCWWNSRGCYQSIRVVCFATQADDLRTKTSVSDLNFNLYTKVLTEYKRILTNN